MDSSERFIFESMGEKRSLELELPLTITACDTFPLIPLLAESSILKSPEGISSGIVAKSCDCEAYNDRSESDDGHVWLRFNERFVLVG